MADKLRYDFINSLPHPLIGRFCGGDEWPICDIVVETGLLRIDVCGKLQVKSFGEVIFIRDGAGNTHDSDIFYNEGC